MASHQKGRFDDAWGGSLRQERPGHVMSSDIFHQRDYEAGTGFRPVSDQPALKQGRAWGLAQEKAPAIVSSKTKAVGWVRRVDVRLFNKDSSFDLFVRSTSELLKTAEVVVQWKMGHIDPEKAKQMRQAIAAETAPERERKKAEADARQAVDEAEEAAREEARMAAAALVEKQRKQQEKRRAAEAKKMEKHRAAKQQLDAERAIARQVKQHMDLVLPSGLIDVTRGPFDKTLLRKTAEVTRTRAEELLTVVVPQRISAEYHNILSKKGKVVTPKRLEEIVRGIVKKFGQIELLRAAHERNAKAYLDALAALWKWAWRDQDTDVTWITAKGQKQQPQQKKSADEGRGLGGGKRKAGGSEEEPGSAAKKVKGKK